MTKVLVPILLILGLLVGVYLVSQKTNLFSRADISTAPQEIKVTNISDNSFTVSWITDKTTTGFVSYGISESLGSAVSDDRDTKERITHHVTIKNLDPDTAYYFKIGSGANMYDDQGKLFQQKTAPSTEKPPDVPEPVFGKIVKIGGGIPDEGVVYLNTGQSSPLSSYIRSDGNFLITLNNARTVDLASYLSLQEDDLLDIFVDTGDGGTVKKQVVAKERSRALSLTLEAPKVAFQNEGIKGDLNGDGVVNAFDYANLVGCLDIKKRVPGFNCPNPTIADLNDNGTVDLQDLSILIFNFRHRQGD